MTFLKRYGYGSIGFNFLLAAYVLEWSILVRGWLESSHEGAAHGKFLMNVERYFNFFEAKNTICDLDNLFFGKINALKKMALNILFVEGFLIYFLFS